METAVFLTATFCSGSVVPSARCPNATTTLYSKLKSDEKLQAHILPLLNLSENSIMEKYYQMNIF